MTYEEIRYTVAAGVALIELNRPAQLNAWTFVMQREVRAAVDAASADPDVRAIVVTGAGRGFCAGADMNALRPPKPAAPDAGGDVRPRGDRRLERAHDYWLAAPKPIIAAINGPCAGVGLVLTLYADIRFAAADAVFTTAFSRRGLIAEHGAAWLLPRLVGMGRAADLLYSSRRLDAEEAYRIGLVDRVCPPEDLRAEALDYARMLAAEVSPRSLREMKRALWEAQLQTLGEAIDQADADMKASFRSDDFREGVAHFIEKRPPRFTGR